MGKGRWMLNQGMNFSGGGQDKERRRVLQMLWNFVSILIISTLLYHWPSPAALPLVPERPFEEAWPTVVEMMDWAGTNDGTGKFRKISQDAYETKWEMHYGIGTKITRIYINGKDINDGVEKTEIDD